MRALRTWEVILGGLFVGCDGPAENGVMELDGRDIAPLQDGLDADFETDVDTTPAPPQSLCALGCLPISVEGAPLEVAFQQGDGAPPLLMGGEAPEGTWVLRRVDIFPEGAFIEGMTVTFGNAGETAGRALFGGDAMAMMLNLHLQVTVDAFGLSGTGDGRGVVSLGGCHGLNAGKVTGTLDTCASGFPEGTRPPETLEFEYGGNQSPLKLGVELTRDTLVSMLPAEQQTSAGELFIGSIRLVATFERP